ncbi:MAG: hypothetical protein PHQ62_00395 [Clostridia bacterium]|nr:hypothetical protein [Clostridia bacterium]
MTKYFIAWILNIEEDDPIPFEVKHIYFCLHRQGDFFYISMGGCELEQDIAFSFEYYPLEAQFFDIYNLKKDFSMHDFKILVRDILNNAQIDAIFDKKNIYIALFAEKSCYKFEKE